MEFLVNAMVTRSSPSFVITPVIRHRRTRDVAAHRDTADYNGFRDIAAAPVSLEELFVSLVKE